MKKCFKSGSEWFNNYRSSFRSKNPDDYGFVYFLKCGEAYKIGISKGLSGRISALQTANPEKIELASWAIVSKYREFEELLQLMYQKQNIHGEWYRLEENQVETIKGLLGSNNIANN